MGCKYGQQFVLHFNGAIVKSYLVILYFFVVPMQNLCGLNAMMFEFLHLNTLCGSKHTSFLTLSIGPVTHSRSKTVVFANSQLTGFLLSLGVNSVTSLVESKKAQLVIIAHDVDPIEVCILTPRT